MAEQQTAKSPLTNVGGAEGLKPQPVKQNVDVVYGSNWIEDHGIWPGATIAEVLADGDLREQAGYGNLKEGNTIYAIDGKVVPADTVVLDHKKEGQKLTLEVLKQVGEKA